MDGAACIPNIGPVGRRRRRRTGFAAGAVGVLLAAGLWAAAINPWGRAVCFLPFFVSGICFFQAREST